MFDLASLSLQPPASFPELYQELWWYSGSYAISPSATAGASSSVLVKGTTTPGSGNALFTCPSNWNASTKVALEVALEAQVSTCSANAGLWDYTSNSLVSGSTVSTTSTTFTVVRSGQFTLIAGHTYGVTVWRGTTASNIYATDASLIIFPPAGSVSPSLSSISLANPSGGSLKEAFTPLWVYSSGTASTTSSAYVQKGSTTITATKSSATTLLPLSSNWSSGQKFALEGSIYIANSSASANLNLIDMTSSTVVSGSGISTTSTTATVLRSGSFTLTPGHAYGLQLGTTSGSYAAYLTKAHLVALGG